VPVLAARRTSNTYVRPQAASARKRRYKQLSVSVARQTRQHAACLGGAGPRGGRSRYSRLSGVAGARGKRDSCAEEVKTLDVLPCWATDAAARSSKWKLAISEVINAVTGGGPKCAVSRARSTSEWRQHRSRGIMRAGDTKSAGRGSRSAAIRVAEVEATRRRQQQPLSRGKSAQRSASPAGAQFVQRNRSRG